MTVGIVGVGEIGKRLAKICRNGFGMRVLGNQRRLDRLPPEAEPANWTGWWRSRISLFSLARFRRRRIICSMEPESRR